MSSNPALDRRVLSYREWAAANLHNTVHLPRRTCEFCRGVMLNSKFFACYQCNSYGPGTADLVGSLVYGCRDMPSGDVMHGYKSPQASSPEVFSVGMLTAAGLHHRRCASALIGIPSRHWAAVPSLRNVGSTHRFREILTALNEGQTEIKVVANESAARATDGQRRALNPGYYDIVTPIPRGCHVTVIDDTWVSGGHAQSVAVALKHAGAAAVSILAIARWLDMDKPRTQRIYADHIRQRPYDPDICPWTGGGCPPGRVLGDERPQMRCSMHNIALNRTGECDECAKLITRRTESAKPDTKADDGAKPVPKPTKSTSPRKPWWQFW